MSAERYVLTSKLLGHLGEHDQALAVASDGLSSFPYDGALLSQRGTLRLLARDLAGAVADLEEAVRQPIAPETADTYRADIVGLTVEALVGQQASTAPTAATPSLASTVRLHLGLARYLLGEYRQAASELAQAASLARVPYQLLAALDYGYLAHYRSGRIDRAHDLLASVPSGPGELPPVPAGPGQALANCYAQRLRLYRGECEPQDLLVATSDRDTDVATLGYGVGAWYLTRGYDAPAARTFERILTVGDPMSMGFLAAEAEHARLTAQVTDPSTLSAPASVGSHH